MFYSQRHAIHNMHELLSAFNSSEMGFMSLVVGRLKEIKKTERWGSFHTQDIRIINQSYVVKENMTKIIIGHKDHDQFM